MTTNMASSSSSPETDGELNGLLDIKPLKQDLIAKQLDQTSDSGEGAIDMLLITANVGSIFEEPKALISQWMVQVVAHLRAQKPQFVAIHCQEVGQRPFRKSFKLIPFFRPQVGGKNSSQGMEFVPGFITSLRDMSKQLGFDRVAAYFDGDFATQEKFTALGSIYLIHESVPHIEIYNFKVQRKCFVWSVFCLNFNCVRIRRKNVSRR